MTQAWYIVVGDAIGSVPYAFLVARRAERVDIRCAGSRNVGAANVWCGAGTVRRIGAPRPGG